ncbi:signal transduction histidine kinase [Thermocatellispora tengchongensis]|uniref:histidine kinase n=1 Tax=Thermocatellispora tengchongensis TaxID=1073253 RepID=A0A840PIF2_9ACTN|nr:sensor histidine kinase [Thermocatellispora tengchongensis]MBB5136887.1 signal transduction histidine kinase [Thermocatellispora tengchongensis]
MTGWAGWGRWRAAAPYTPFLAAAVLAVAALAESLAGSLGTAHAARFDHTVSRPAPGMTGLPPGVPHPVAPPPPTGRDAALLLVILPLVALATTVPIALVRAQPLAAGVLVTAAIGLSLAAFQILTVAGAAAQPIAGYHLGARGSPRAALLLAAPFPVLALARPSPLIVALACLAPAAALAGIAHRARGEARANGAAGRAAADTLLEHAARGERARIARELHDVVAHHISMVAVQAETARLTTPGMPQAGAERLSAIGDTARAALTEMRRLLGVLREDTGGEASPAARRPQPGLRLAELNELLDEARAASGTAVRLILCGAPAELDPGVELAAYRIVQEALTNARRHAPGAAVDVELHYTGEDLRVSIRDNGPGPAARPGPGGHGLAGMRERACAVGGELTTGPAPGGGFLVQAHLPAGDEAAG